MRKETCSRCGTTEDVGLCRLCDACADAWVVEIRTKAGLTPYIEDPVDLAFTASLMCPPWR